MVCVATAAAGGLSGDDAGASSVSEVATKHGEADTWGPGGDVELYATKLGGFGGIEVDGDFSVSRFGAQKPVNVIKVDKNFVSKSAFEVDTALGGVRVVDGGDGGDVFARVVDGGEFDPLA